MVTTMMNSIRVTTLITDIRRLGKSDCKLQVVKRLERECKKLAFER